MKQVMHIRLSWSLRQHHHQLLATSIVPSCSRNIQVTSTSIQYVAKFIFTNMGLLLLTSEKCSSASCPRSSSRHLASARPLLDARMVSDKKKLPQAKHLRVMIITSLQKLYARILKLNTAQQQECRYTALINAQIIQSFRKDLL